MRPSTSTMTNTGSHVDNASLFWIHNCFNHYDSFSNMTLTGEVYVLCNGENWGKSALDRIKGRIRNKNRSQASSTTSHAENRNEDRQHTRWKQTHESIGNGKNKALTSHRQRIHLFEEHQPTIVFKILRCNNSNGSLAPGKGFQHQFTSKKGNWKPGCMYSRLNESGFKFQPRKSAANA